MDKSWMSDSRLSTSYLLGVNSFLEFAKQNAKDEDFIPCPCTVCENFQKSNILDIKNHLFLNDIDQTYREWIWHGESSLREQHGGDSVHEDVLFEEPEDAVNTIDMVQGGQENNTGNFEAFQKLLEDAHKPLYPGCKKFTKLSGLVNLFNLKAKHGWSDTSFTSLLQLLVKMLPEENELPQTMAKSMKTLSLFGLGYQKIHACPNDCILYRKEYKDMTTCPTCGKSRYKINKNTNEEKIGVPAKVLWYFPPIPRFKRWFQSEVISKDLTWHANEREDDGMLRHPADSPAWKLVDEKWPEFKKEPRHLRLALSADGINPYSSLSSRRTCWPVMLSTYNLPPSLYMKRKFILLTLLISGPRQPGNDIDVYLAPLIEDLITLFSKGVLAHDASRKESFTLKAILLWTINDFPAYGNLCGCTVKGFHACPVCSEQTNSIRLDKSSKNIYMAHRAFLPLNHPFRKQKKPFDGRQEFRIAPVPLSGEEILKKVEGIKVCWGKKVKSENKKPGEKRKRVARQSIKTGATKSHDKTSKSSSTIVDCWKKKSIFFDLPYWQHLLIRHNLDVMHIEKNVCDNIVGTLLNIPGKTKDGVNSRKDLVDLGIRTELAPQLKGKRTYLPPASFTLSRPEKTKVCETLLRLKVPDGYSSNFANLVSMEELKLYGLKSHDCHVLMQQILPVALRSVLPKQVRHAIIRVCHFFNSLCAKVIDVNKLDEVQDNIVITLCLLEKYFPPSFFDIMVHLMIHLVREVRLCGPVHFRWMFGYERNMKVYKGNVGNRNCPEGSIAQRFVVEEAIEFCTEFLIDLDAIGVPRQRNVSDNIEGKDVDRGQPFGGITTVEVEDHLWEQAHRYVLQNTDVIQPYVDEHMDLLRQQHPRKSRQQKLLQEEHNKTFISWIKKKVEELQETQDDSITDLLIWLSRGPRRDVMTCPGLLVNNWRFHTKERDTRHVTQNSGVSLLATTMQISSAKDKNPIISPVTFYGVITQIWILDYTTFKVPVLRCDWVDSAAGVKTDELGNTLVQLGRIGHKNDQFILASQAKQVFYVPDQLDENWSIVLVNPQRVCNNDDDNVVECLRDQLHSNSLPNVDEEDVDGHIRTDCDGTWIEQ